MDNKKELQKKKAADEYEMIHGKLADHPERDSDGNGRSDLLEAIEQTEENSIHPKLKKRTKIEATYNPVKAGLLYVTGNDQKSEDEPCIVDALIR